MVRPGGRATRGRIPELHVNHDDTAVSLFRGRKRLPPILVLRVLEGKIDPLTAAILLAASNLFDDPGIQHRITSFWSCSWL
jgi:hypothetical protein